METRVEIYMGEEGRYPTLRLGTPPTGAISGGWFSSGSAPARLRRLRPSFSVLRDRENLEYIKEPLIDQELKDSDIELSP